MSHITAQDIYSYTKCPFRVYLDENGDTSAKVKINSFVQLLWESGVKNEKDIIHSIGLDQIVEVKEKDIKEAFGRTIELMGDGAATIYQGCLIKDDMIGRPDLLIRRNDHESNYGDYYYEVVDIKSGKGVEDERSQRFKKHYAYQIIFYNDLLKSLQGYVCGKGKIINGNKETEEFLLSDLREEYGKALDEIRILKAGPGSHEPIIGSGCSLCVWDKYCKGWANKVDDPTLIFFVGKNKYLLKSRGLKTVEDISDISVDKFLKPPLKMKGLAEKTLERMKKRANVIKNGVPEIRSGFKFPNAQKEIYFDIEDDPTQSLVYLFGLYIIGNDGRCAFQYFLADKPDKEETAIRSLWEFIKKQ